MGVDRLPFSRDSFPVNLFKLACCDSIGMYVVAFDVHILAKCSLFSSKFT